MRYVGRYRREAIQCREDNIQPTSLRIAGFYVNPGLLRRVSMVRIASAEAASQRRCAGAAHLGQGEALPCPGAMRRDGGRGTRPRGGETTFMLSCIVW
ncbi:MAG: hypothetical protein LBM98_13155 [Oscillospiraceae bacterium]|nr:hypothetical protein [Oscillospiraceae bacterium]